ncbi:MAG: hypothetical protein MK008_01685 [Bdellovibrionales bacterium]|nr:hypothetical protein [Bdellovibrionales bacterium]
MSVIFIFFSISAFAEDFSFRTNESFNILQRLVQSFPELYNYDGFIENTKHRYITHFESSFFEALARNEYIHPSGRNFTLQEKLLIRQKLIQTANGYVRNQHNMINEYEKFEGETYTHIKRVGILVVQIALQVEKVIASVAKFHDRLKLVADIYELYRLGYPSEIKATILDFLVANQKFKKNDVSDGQILIRDKHGDLSRLPLAFAIHELNRMEKNELYNYFIENGHAERLSKNRIVLKPKAIIAKVFETIADHEDAISRKDLGNPKNLTSASKYLSNLNKAPAIELKGLLSALNTDLSKIAPVFEYFEGLGFKSYQNLVSHKITNIQDYYREKTVSSNSCFILFW